MTESSMQKRRPQAPFFFCVIAGREPDKGGGITPTALMTL